jgi:DNA-binding response OmpR family regulator
MSDAGAHALSRRKLADHLCPVCGGPRNFTSPIVFHNEEAYWQGARLKLSPTEAQYLKVLSDRPRTVVSKESMYILLYAHLPDCDQPAEKIMDVYMCKLRKRLKQAGVPIVIETYWGRGWLLREADDVPSAA